MKVCMQLSNQTEAAIYISVSYTHLRAHETDSYLVCRLLLEKKKQKKLENDNKMLSYK